MIRLETYYIPNPKFEVRLAVDENKIIEEKVKIANVREEKVLIDQAYNFPHEEMILKKTQLNFEAIMMKLKESLQCCLHNFQIY